MAERVASIVKFSGFGLVFCKLPLMGVGFSSHAVLPRSKADCWQVMLSVRFASNCGARDCLALAAAVAEHQLPGPASEVYCWLLVYPAGTARPGWRSKVLVKLCAVCTGKQMLP